VHAYNVRTSSDYNRYVHKLELCNSKPTIAGCKSCNKLPTYIKQIRNNHLFERKWKELPIKGSYCSMEEYMNNGFMQILVSDA
jgi:hypothetical protein